ncbi:hypothetical protein JJD41_01325 [Oxynema sp. CENA135]|uniref:hypothetical protein n=1 Tax=Oxynema sp. CENA135 TaxID=984206 RepID=UPI00190C180F|nr:hypothetical protein [Oxynema sp. CENA135]MBK4728531.1 hypothetical protein [Oxynema sp. CENA135]
MHRLDEISARSTSRQLGAISTADLEGRSLILKRLTGERSPLPPSVPPDSPSIANLNPKF